MQLSYLIMVHEDPAQFRRLVHALNGPGVQFFIHIDSKSDFARFNAFLGKPNVTYLERRLDVNAGGFSLTQAMIELLTAAVSASEKPDYYAFLSGLDYPIKPAGEIHEFLERQWPTNFINFYPLIGDAPYSRNLRRYHFVDTFAKLPSTIRPLCMRAVSKLMSSLPERRDPGMIPYRGSQWFCLNRETVDYVLGFIRQPVNQNMIRFFRRTWGSDEIFFQTIILNSPHAALCRVDGGDLTKGMIYRLHQHDSYLHHIDWSPVREDPAVFDLEDFDTLMQSDMLFARKFRSEKSGPLLDAIDREVGHVIASG